MAPHRASGLGVTLLLLFAVSPDMGPRQDGAIDRGFRNHRSRTAVVLEPNLEGELKRAYADALGKLKPNDFANPAAAARALAHYASAEGVEAILTEWLAATDASWNEIFSIDMELYLRVYFASKNPNANPKFSENMKNKYATIVVRTTPEQPDALILIDGRPVASVKEATNGIKVRSGVEYAVEVKNMKSSVCRERSRTTPQETSIVQCRRAHPSPQ